MDALNLIFANIVASASGLVPILYSLLIGAGLDIASGSWAAWKSGTFDSKFFPEFIKGHIILKITPIMLVLLAGVSVGGLGTPAGIAIVATGGVAALAYLESIVAGIKNNITAGNEGTKGLPSTVNVNTIIIPAGPLTDATDPDAV